ncbi:MAG: PH domain-containing protein [Acidobacteriota bacterium]
MQSFAIAPAAGRVMWIVPIAVALVLVPVVGLLGRSVLAGSRARFELSDAGLQLRGDWYGRVISANQLRPASARRIDFSASPELAPQRRTMGTGLPGYQAGWFRLGSGEQALLYLTDRGKVVYVPTTNGYSLLLSPDDPEAFLAALRSMGPGR